ncbi:MAG: curlin repeat-containing protein [Yoonia sp.]|nr:curlin repeat-containing protein [Yoonia sp.]
MRRTLIISAFLCIPLAAVGQDRAITLQVGEGNQQLTAQSGSNIAVTQQFGRNNTASTMQDGRNNVATIVQIGENHVRSVQQVGNNLGYGSVQVTHEKFTSSFSGVGGNAFTSTTLDIDVEN